MPQSRNALQEISIVERIPPMATGIYTGADILLTRLAAAMAKVLVETGRHLMEKQS